MDKPGRFSAVYLNASFTNLTAGGNLTYAALESWVETNFLGEGEELEAANISDFNPAPLFLQNISNAYVRGFAQEVNGACPLGDRAHARSAVWPRLARQTVRNATFNGASSLIPLNYSFVVPGGRFREN